MNRTVSECLMGRKWCCDTTNLHCTPFIYYYTTMLWYHKASFYSFFSFHPKVLWHHKLSLYSFHFFLHNNAVAQKSFIILIHCLSFQQCCDNTYLHCICSYPTMLWHCNSVVTPQSFIIVVPIQQCCDTTKLHCPHSISSHTTMLWYHKASLHSFHLYTTML